MPSTSTLDALLAYEQIRQLAARYAVALDSRDLDALVALFVDDVQVGRSGRGRAALRAMFDTTLRQVGVTILNVGTHVIDLVDADHATGIVYSHGEIQDGDRWIHQAIMYRDTYEQRDGRWYFVRRVHELFYGQAQATSPLTLPPADWPAHHDGRGTAPESFASWHEFWQHGQGS